MLSADSLLIIFSKAPVDGRVNTRLIPHIGSTAATRLQHELLIYRMQQFAYSEDFAVELFCAPDIEHELFQLCRQRYGMVLQNQDGDDLGEKMLRAFQSGCARYSKVILIGTDAPAVDMACVEQAMSALDDHEIVITPAEDGGYVLIAMKQAYEAVFDSVNWGSAEVLSQTRDNIIKLGCRYHELPTSWDIDRPEDLQRFESLKLSSLVASY